MFPSFTMGMRPTSQLIPEEEEVRRTRGVTMVTMAVFIGDITVCPGEQLPLTRWFSKDVIRSFETAP